jgi:hypothetical protein
VPSVGSQEEADGQALAGVVEDFFAEDREGVERRPLPTAIPARRRARRSIRDSSTRFSCRAYWATPSRSRTADSKVSSPSHIRNWTSAESGNACTSRRAVSVRRDRGPVEGPERVGGPGRAEGLNPLGVLQQRVVGQPLLDGNEIAGRFRANGGRER